MSSYIEVIAERLGYGASRPITKVIFDGQSDMVGSPAQIRVEVAGHSALCLSVSDARKLGDALTVATGRSFLRRNGGAR